MAKCTVLLSGGLDSVTLLYHAIKEQGFDEVYALSFNYGQKHKRELQAASWHCEKLEEVKEHRVLDISFMEDYLKGASSLVGDQIDVPALEDIEEADLDQPVTYVPNRNMILLSLAASYAEARGCQDLFYGAQSQDEYGYWDCTTDFLENMNNVLSLNRRDAITIHAPFVSLRKADEIKLGMNYGVDYSQTWTCYRGTEIPCGECPSCVERAIAFDECGIEDPLLKSK